MAKIQVSIGFRGAKPTVRRVPVDVPKGTQTLAQVTTWTNNFLATVAPLLDGALVDAYVKIPLAISSSLTYPTVTPDAQSITNVGALFSFLNSAERAYDIFIPTFKEALKSKDIPLGTAPMDDFVAAVVTGVTNGTDVIGVIDPNELDIIEAVRAYGTTRK